MFRQAISRELVFLLTSAGNKQMDGAVLGVLASLHSHGFPEPPTFMTCSSSFQFLVGEQERRPEAVGVGF